MVDFEILIHAADLSAQQRTRHKFAWDRAFPILTLVPSLAALGVFVYGFIFWSGSVLTHEFQIS